MLQINQLPEATEANNTDLIPIQTSGGITKKITRENFLEGITGETTSTLPTDFTHWHDQSIVVTGNAIRADIVSSYLYGIEIYQNPPAINDAFKFSKVLAAGNYRIGILTATKTNLAKLKLEINNILAFDDLDCYSASQNLNAYLYRDISISSDGLQEFKFTVYDKNLNSSNWFFSGRKFWGYKL